MSDVKTCPYEILSVSRTASLEEIKKSYKRLAIVHHPDKNQGSAEATQMFQKISAAYAILSDPEKRERYDATGSLDENDMEGPDMDDIMQMFFQSFGHNVMFGGGPMFFEMGGHGRRHRGGASFSHENIFADLMHGFDFEGYDDDDMYEEDDYDDDLDDLEDFVEEVLPALFCEHFIEELDTLPTEQPVVQQVPGDKKKKKKPDNRPIFRCKLCKQIMRTVDGAETHYMENHPILMERFVEILMKEGMESDVSELFETFASKVIAGEITEKKPRKKPSKKKRKKRVSVAERLAAQQRAPQTSNA